MRAVACCDTYASYLKIFMNDYYVVVFRASAASIFWHEVIMDSICLYEQEEIIIKAQTRWIDKGVEHKIPGDMAIYCRGTAINIEDAVFKFSNCAGFLAQVIGFTTNAAVNGLSFEIAYNDTPGLIKREYLQNIFPEEHLLPNEFHEICIDTTKYLIEKISNHPEKERINRAIAQYNIALQHWHFEEETFATEYLYIGIENLTKAVVRKQQGDQSEIDFACQLGINPEKLGQCSRLSSVIESTVRRDIIFKKDIDCYKEARKASDGFEHGFLPFGEIREKAAKVRNKTAEYLRGAILDLLDISKEYKEKLTSGSKAEPLGNRPIAKYIKGELRGSSTKLAGEGSLYPFVNYKEFLTSTRITDKGLETNIEYEFRPIISKEIEFAYYGVEFWRI